MAAILGGALGAITTIYDRSNLKDAAAEGGELGNLVQVGWGLNLAMIASISFAISGAVWLLKFVQETTPAAPVIEPAEPKTPSEQT